MTRSRGGGLGVVAALAVSTSLSANRPQPLAWQFEASTPFTYDRQWDPTIEIQSWWLSGSVKDPNHTVYNPRPDCEWDINDHNDFGAGPGYLNALETTSRRGCMIFDPTPVYFCQAGTCQWLSWYYENAVGIQVFAPSQNLEVSLCFQPGRCFTPQGVYDGAARAYVYSVCAQARYPKDDPLVQFIDGSGFGYGVITGYTETIRNPTGNPIKGIRARWGVTSDWITIAACGHLSEFNGYATPRDGVWQFTVS